ncbi:MAG: hypothetical protein ACE5EU_06900, partial [Paracoccaceae bacterium]
MARIRKTLLTLIVLLGLVLAAGLVWREAAVETAARLVLASRGLGGAQLEVVAVGRTGIVIENAAIGAGLLSARRMRLTYHLAGLASGRLRDLRVEGLRLDLRQDRDGMLARLEELVSGEGGPWVELPRVALEGAEIVLASPAAGTVAIDGELDLSGAAVGVALEAGLDLGHTVAALTIRSEDIGENGVLEIDGSGATELAGLALPGPAGVAATGGRARFAVAGTAQIPARDTASPQSWLAGALSLEGDLNLDGVTSSAGPAVLSADIGWALSGGDGALRLDLPRPARLTAGGIGRGVLAALHLRAGDGAPPDLAVELSASGPAVAWSPRGDGGVAEFAGDIAVALGDATAQIRAAAKVEHDASWRLSAPATVDVRARAAGFALAAAGGGGQLRRSEWVAAGALTPDGALVLQGSVAAEVGDVSLAGVNAGAASVDGNVRVRRMPGQWSLAAAPGLTVAIESFASPGRLEIAGPAVLTVDRLEASGGDALARLDISASTRQVSGVLPGGEGRDV